MTRSVPWNTKWAAQKADEALRYLERNYPECLETCGSQMSTRRPPMRLLWPVMRMLTSRPSDAICELVGTRPYRVVEGRRETNIC
jgi:hypothetical protein